MNTYRNTVTGAVVSTFGKVSGGNWVPVKESKKKDSEPAADKEKEGE